MNGDVYRMSVLSHQTTSLKRFVQTYHWADDTSGVRLDLNVASDDFWAANGVTCENAACSDTVFDSVSMQCLIGPSAGDIGVSSFAPVPGNLAVSNVATELCIAITRKIPRAGRHFRGRVFWGPLLQLFFTNFAEGIVNTGDAALVAMSNMIKNGYVTQAVSLNPVLVHGAGKPVVYTRNPGVILSSTVSPEVVHRRPRRVGLD